MTYVRVPTALNNLLRHVYKQDRHVQMFMNHRQSTLDDKIPAEMLKTPEGYAELEEKVREFVNRPKR